MATIRQKGAEQWHAQVRRTGWPPITETLPTRKEAEAWARNVESQMDRGIFVDRSAAERTTLGERIEVYKKEVTAKRPGEASRAAESSRLDRFVRDEPKLCAHAVAHLRPEHFEEYRDRRLTQIVTRGKPDGRGRYKPEKMKPGRVRKDGTPRANAAQPKAPPKPAKAVAPGTVKRELTLLKRVLDYKKRKLGLLINPINTEDVKRPVVNDEREVRLDAGCEKEASDRSRSIVRWGTHNRIRTGVSGLGIQRPDQLDNAGALSQSGTVCIRRDEPLRRELRSLRQPGSQRSNAL